jgi:hypothetical protein
MPRQLRHRSWWDTGRPVDGVSVLRNWFRRIEQRRLGLDATTRGARLGLDAAPDAALIAGYLNACVKGKARSGGLTGEEVE